MAINSTPTTDKPGNEPNTIQVDPKEHLTWDHEDTPKSHDNHFQFILINYTTPYSPHLTYNQVPHQ